MKQHSMEKASIFQFFQLLQTAQFSIEKESSLKADLEIEAAEEVG